MGPPRRPASWEEQEMQPATGERAGAAIAWPCETGGVPNKNAAEMAMLGLDDLLGKNRWLERVRAKMAMLGLDDLPGRNCWLGRVVGAKRGSLLFPTESKTSFLQPSQKNLLQIA